VVRLAREGVEDILADSPSLKNKLGDTIREAYRRARIEAADETGLALDAFPENCPWQLDRFMADDFWPKA
jgi:Domain of unknown function DUF29